LHAGLERILGIEALPGAIMKEHENVEYADTSRSARFQFLSLELVQTAGMEGPTMEETKKTIVELRS